MDNTVRIRLVEDDDFYRTILKASIDDIDDCLAIDYSCASDFFADKSHKANIVILDYELPDLNGIDILRRIKNECPDCAVVILSGQKSIEVVVEAYKSGADRYIMKDDQALVEIKRYIGLYVQNYAQKLELEALRDKMIDSHSYSNIIGSSAAMQKVYRLMQKVVNIQMPILVTGPNGTGKELVANALHFNSNRSKKPFVAVNVAAIPEDLIESELFGSEKGAYTGAVKRKGKFEEANYGTIFLDEIGELDLALQSKLLRVLQEKKVQRLGGSREINLDLKIISATNKNLWEETKKGRFREDLYFRLQSFIIELPPLRERANDIIMLAKSFCKDFANKNKVIDKQMDPQAIKALLNYSWPGNVRELKGMMERAMIISDSDTIGIDDLIFLDHMEKVA